MKIIKNLHKQWIFLAQYPLLDPDPYIEYGSGSRRRFEYGSTQTLILTLWNRLQILNSIKGYRTCTVLKWGQEKLYDKETKNLAKLVTGTQLRYVSYHVNKAQRRKPELKINCFGIMIESFMKSLEKNELLVSFCVCDRNKE